MVKKILLAVLMVAGVSTMNAQENKFYTGGTLGFSWSKLKNDGVDMKGASFKIMPEIGYNLNKKIDLGVSFGYSRGYAAFGSIDFNDFKSIANTVAGTASDIASDDIAKLNSFRVTPYVRYNFYQTGKLKLFVEGSLGYVWVGTDSDALANRIGDDPSINLIEINIRPGISFDVTKKLSLIAKVGSFGFIHAKEKETELKINRFGLDVDSYNILLGMNYHF